MEKKIMNELRELKTQIEEINSKMEVLVKLDQMLTAAEKSAGILPLVEDETLVLQ